MGFSSLNLLSKLRVAILGAVLNGQLGQRGQPVMQAAARETDLDGAIVSMAVLALVYHMNSLAARQSILDTLIGPLGRNARHLVATVQEVENGDESAADTLTSRLIAALILLITRHGPTGPPAQGKLSFEVRF